MKVLETQIEIKAGPEKVWQALTQLNAYAGWNPFIIEGDGAVNEGQRLKVKIHPPGGKAMTFKPKVTRVVPNREFRWQGKLGIPGIFDGEHIFRLEPTAEGVRLVHKERFKGLRVPLLWKELDTKTRAGFHAMNEALKQLAEAS